MYDKALARKNLRSDTKNEFIRLITGYPVPRTEPWNEFENLILRHNGELDIFNEALTELCNNAVEQNKPEVFQLLKTSFGGYTQFYEFAIKPVEIHYNEQIRLSKIITDAFDDQSLVTLERAMMAADQLENCPKPHANLFSTNPKKFLVPLVTIMGLAELEGNCEKNKNHDYSNDFVNLGCKFLDYVERYDYPKEPVWGKALTMLINFDNRHLDGRNFDVLKDFADKLLPRNDTPSPEKPKM